MQKEHRRPIIFDTIGEKVLSMEQMKLAPLLEDFAQTHFLAWGTAIALYLGHRKSIDFDLFSLTPQWTPRTFLERLQPFKDLIDNDELYQEIVAMDMTGYTENQDEYMIKCLGTRCRFINVNRTLYKDQIITFHPENHIQWGIRTIPLRELVGMKCFAMMYRNKWKDAVDLYYILKQWNLSFLEAIQETKNIYNNLYKEEFTYETILQKSWDKTEAVEYLVENPPLDMEIETFLVSEVEKILMS